MSVDSSRADSETGLKSEDVAPLPGPWMPPEQRGGSMPTVDRAILNDWIIRVALLALAALVFFPGLGAFGLWDPWEVHYGEVGRQMLERGDWISPWWGSHWRAPDKTPEGELFFSKPVLLLWMMGIGTQIFGFSDLAIRAGTAVIALLGVCAAYMAGSRVFNQRTGVLMAVVLLTSPFYTMLGRQAQTDMPYVGLMTIAICFFLMGVFGKDRNRRVDRLTVGIFTTFILAVVLPQLHTITVGQLRWRAVAADLPWNVAIGRYAESLICYGPVQLAIYLTLMGVFFWTALRHPQSTRGQVYLYLFYAFVGLATMAKGLLGFALPGAIILVYLLVTREWGLLKRVELVRGVMIALFVGMPWYGAVMARHGGIGGPFWQRFIIHDHFKRLATGVHQIDTGSFEHFIRWLGYGLFPWGSFVPAILARAMSGDATGSRSDEERARTFLFIWFVIAFALFTLSSTKFHHYIFPCVPPLAFLSALILEDLLAGRFTRSAWWPLFVGALSLLALVGFDLVSDPQHLKNLFTYRYDRLWNAEEWNPGFQLVLTALLAVATVGVLLLADPTRRRRVQAGVAVLALQGCGMAVWVLNVYMPTISPSWSQGPLWDTYYKLCTQIEPPPGTHEIKRGRYCEESAISYKLNWRGETYYTQNEILPVRDDAEWRYFLEQNGDRCFYAIMERGRLNAFRNALPAPQRPSAEEVHTENNKFILVRANCGTSAPTSDGSADTDGTP